jgi:hypothetical protein
MTDLERNILAALDELEATVQSRTAGQPMPDLTSLFARVDELTRRLPRISDPELLHFLQRKSYEKARLRLQGRRAERGECGGRSGPKRGDNGI